MLHAPNAESKRQSNATRTPRGPEPQHKLHRGLSESDGAQVKVGSGGSLGSPMGGGRPGAAWQNIFGNQTVLRMIDHSQPAPSFPALNKGASILQRKCECAGAPDCDCDTTKKDKEKQTGGLHRAAAGPAGAQAPRRAPAAVHEVLRSPGQPLDPATQAFFESRFGSDLGGVRIHTDSRAADSARAVQALGYTVGQHIAFARGQYQPEAESGQRLLAHELAHTLQQRGAPLDSGPLPVSDATGPDEQAADRMAAHAITRAMGGSAASAASRPSAVQRQATTDRTPAPGAAAPASTTPAPAPAFQEHEIAAFDVSSGTTRPWNLNQLTRTIVTELTASSRAYVRILGVYPTKPNDDDPQQHAYERADTVRRALIQQIGPGKFGEDRFDVAFADGRIGDPEIRVDIAYHGVVSGPAHVPTPPSRSAQPGAFSLPPTLTLPPSPFAPSPVGPLATPPAPAPSPGTAPPAAPGSQFPAPVTGALDFAWHVNLSGPRGTSRDRTLQLQIGSDQIYQLSYNLDTRLVQHLVGGQVTQNVPLPSNWPETLRRLVQLQAFAQALAGVANYGTPASGSFRVFQPTAGGQLSVTLGPVQFSVQAAASITATERQPTTAELHVTPQITLTF